MTTIYLILTIITIIAAYTGVGFGTYTFLYTYYNQKWLAANETIKTIGSKRDKWGDVVLDRNNEEEKVKNFRLLINYNSLDLKQRVSLREIKNTYDGIILISIFWPIALLWYAILQWPWRLLGASGKAIEKAIEWTATELANPKGNVKTSHLDDTI